jgi:hypothetical protein
VTAVLRAGAHRAPPPNLAARLLGPVSDFLFAAVPDFLIVEISGAWEWLVHGWPEPVDKAPRPKLTVAIKPELPLTPLVRAPRGGTLPDMPIPGYLARRQR